MRPWTSPLLLLLGTGGLLGLTFPFGKIATGAGISPFVWAFLIASGGGGALLAAALATGRRPPAPDARKLRYFLVTAIVSYALPNLLVFSAIPRLGAGFTGLFFTLSPVFTLLISLLAGLKRPTALGVAGIATGFLGAVLVAATRGEIGKPADPFWIGLGLLIPLSLAAGNVYRTLEWPEEAGPLELAIGSNLAAALLLFAASWPFAGGFPLAALPAVWPIALAQVAASAAMFSLFFQLQKVGGPIYLSQISYVGAGVALLSGVLFLGESYAALTWIGAAVIVAGVAMTTIAKG